MIEEATLLEEVEQDLEVTKKVILQKDRDIAEIDRTIQYYKGMYDGANNILQMIKKHLEVKP